MQIAFLLGSCDISGGTYVLIEHATRLNTRGHNVFLVTLNEVNPTQLTWHPAAENVNWLTLEEAKKHRFDFVFATWWQSIFLLEHLSAANYIYFIQSIESRFFPSRDPNILESRDIDVLQQWCESTYRYPIPVITEARWIVEYLKEQYNKEAFLVKNGIRKDIYRPNGSSIVEKKTGNLRALVEGPVDVEFKNIKKTIELCNRSDVDEVWLLTSSNISEYPGVDRCFSNVPIDKTPNIYRSCDVLVKLSYVEGMFGPPLEMFHCGGTAVVYDVTGYDEYIEHKRNSLVVKQGSENDVINCLNRLKNESGLIERLKQGALITASEWPDWSESSHKLEKILEKFDSNFDITPSFLAAHASHFLENRENAFRAREIFRFAERENITNVNTKQFQNFIQVYFHSGEGFSNENMRWEKYQSGDWVVCKVTIPGSQNTMHVRVDPSVRIGVVQIRSLRVTNSESDSQLLKWGAYDSWENIKLAGTAVALRREPFPVFNCYGEDPQLILPPIENNGDLTLEVELKEMSFTQALCCSSSLCKTKKKGRFFKNLRSWLGGNN